MSKAVSDAAIEWFAKLHSDQATPEDWQRFAAWRDANTAHARAYSEVEKLWAALDEPAEQALAEEERQAAGLLPKISPRSCFAGNQTARPQPSSRAKPISALALIAFACLWLPEALRFWASDYHTGWGERRELHLPDGSTVTLNTHSALSVDFSGPRRQVNLMEGEAYFQVAHDAAHPFVVTTRHGTAQALGTAFDVYEQAGRMTVTVTEGRVKLQADADSHRAIELTPGLQASGDTAGVGQALRVETAQALAWRSGILAFDMQPLSSVVDELNRYLPGKILLDPRLRHRVVSGAFDLSHPQDIVSAIEKTLGLGTISLSGTLILLYQAG